jgi:cation:H+ antiporter
MLGAALVLLALLFATSRISRLWGGLMLAAYAAYMVLLFSNGMTS